MSFLRLLSSTKPILSNVSRDNFDRYRRSDRRLQPHTPNSRLSKPSLKMLSFKPSMDDEHEVTIVDKIGGGIGDGAPIVYKGIVFHPYYIVAIKAIDLDRTRPAFRNDRARKLRFSGLRHPNIARCIGSVIKDDRLWVVTPYMDHGSLQSIISSSFPDGLPESFIAIVLREVLKGLCYLHSGGHLHRDIKADNILLAEDFEPQVLLKFYSKYELKMIVSYNRFYLRRIAIPIQLANFHTHKNLPLIIFDFQKYCSSSDLIPFLRCSH